MPYVSDSGLLCHGISPQLCSLHHCPAAGVRAKFRLTVSHHYVGKHPGCTQAELTAALGLDWGYSQRSVTRLVEEGFLIREKSGRAYHLNLSAKGQEAFAVSHQVFADWDKEALAALDDTEREQLLFLLEKVTRKEGISPCMK